MELSNIHKILKSSSTAMSNKPLEWDVRLDFFKLQYNMAKHRATVFPPAFLFFGRNLRTPFTAHMSAEQIRIQAYVKYRVQHMHEVKLQALAEQQKVMVEYVKEDELDKTTTLELGQKVYLKCTVPTVLQKKFKGFI